MQLVAVILGAQTKDDRNDAARELLNYGFANYTIFEAPEAFLENTYLRGGKTDSTALFRTGFKVVVDKSHGTKVEEIYDIPEFLVAPIKDNDVVGKVTYKIGEEVIGESSIYVKDGVERINLFDVVARLLKKIVVGE
jgi:D-alanyl-D-alanine carboxypeptidase (penicillin-binding protein 5/6)